MRPEVLLLRVLNQIQRAQRLAGAKPRHHLQIRQYFDALGAYREGDVAPIVARLSGASALAVANGRQLVADLRSVREEWNSRIAARRDSAVHRVADLLIKHPVANAKFLQRELDIGTGNARRYIDPLVEAGIIVEFTDRARNRAWRAPEVLSALDAFAVRAGRRNLRSS